MKEQWMQVLNLLESRISKETFYVWIKGTSAHVEDNNWTIVVTNEFARVLLEENYVELIKEAIFEITNERPNITIKTEKTSTLNTIIQLIDTLSTADREHLFSLLKQRYTNEPLRIPLQIHYTFDDFTEKEGNIIALQAAKTIANSLCNAYNPLHIYGESGVGKTHLLHAIGNEVLAKDASKNVIYTTAEQFSNHYLDSVRKNQLDQFQAYYASADLLLFDDIQDLDGKDDDQEQFLCIFKQLLDNSKQIVIASEQNLEQVVNISDTLRTRFKRGLAVDITASETQDTRIDLQQVEKMEKDLKKLKERILEFESRTKGMK